MANELTQSPDAAVCVQQVIKWVVDGMSEYDVANAISVQFPGIKTADVFAAAMIHFERSGTFDANVVTGWVFESTKEVYRRALEAGDFSTALRALGQIGKLADVRYSVQEKEGESQE